MAEQSRLFVQSTSSSRVPLAPAGGAFWSRTLNNGRLQLLRVLVAVGAILFFFVLWEGLVLWRQYPTFILPRPIDVWFKFQMMIADGSLWRHARVTLVEIIGGLALGLSLATILGYLLARSPGFERLVSPYLVALQSFPIIAVAPLLVIWIRDPEQRTILICALTLFFPALVNTIVGLRSVEPELLALMRSLRATRWQIFRKLEIPSALPVLFGGLKVGATLSVIGAVIGEFVGANSGLGFLINLGRGLLDTPLLFVALFALVVIALGLYSLVSLLEYHFLAWRRAR